MADGPPQEAPSQGKPPPEPPPVGTFKDLIPHADRWWKAEEANATRFATKTNLVASGITAVLGATLALFGKSAEAVLAIPPRLWELQAVYVVLAVASLALLWVALTKTLRRTTLKEPNRTGTVSSELMVLPKALEQKPQDFTEPELHEVVFVTTYRAAIALSERNGQRANMIGSAQRCFLWAIVTLTLTLCVYVVISVVNKQLADAGVHGNDRFQLHNSAERQEPGDSGRVNSSGVHPVDR